jgi:hypothetical protein
MEDTTITMNGKKAVITAPYFQLKIHLKSFCDLNALPSVLEEAMQIMLATDSISDEVRKKYVGIYRE